MNAARTVTSIRTQLIEQAAERVSIAHGKATGLAWRVDNHIAPNSLHANLPAFTGGVVEQLANVRGHGEAARDLLSIASGSNARNSRTNMALAHVDEGLTNLRHMHAELDQIAEMERLHTDPRSEALRALREAAATHAYQTSDSFLAARRITSDLRNSR